MTGDVEIVRAECRICGDIIGWGFESYCDICKVKHLGMPAKKFIYKRALINMVNQVNKLSKQWVYDGWVDYGVVGCYSHHGLPPTVNLGFAQVWHSGIDVARITWRGVEHILHKKNGRWQYEGACA